jgi:hypothetical protein
MLVDTFSPTAALNASKSPSDWEGDFGVPEPDKN